MTRWSYGWKTTNCYPHQWTVSTVPTQCRGQRTANLEMATIGDASTGNALRRKEPPQRFEKAASPHWSTCSSSVKFAVNFFKLIQLNFWIWRKLFLEFCWAYFTFLSCVEHFFLSQIRQYESNKLGGGYLSWSKLGGVNFSWSKLGGLKLTRPMWGV